MTEPTPTPTEPQQSNEEPTPDPTPEPEKSDPWADAETARKEIEKLRKENAAIRVKEKASRPKAEQYDKLVADQKTAEQKAQDAATAAEKRAQVAISRSVRAEIKAIASDTFADPNDPADTLDVSKYANDDGEVDTDAIKNDLGELLKRKPHWGKTPERRGPLPDKSQGSSSQGRVPVEAQIADAKSKGDWKTVLHLENQKLTDYYRKNN